MEKIYFKEKNDIDDDIIKIEWEESRSRFTPNRPYIIVETNYITDKRFETQVKSYLIKNDYGVGAWVYDSCFNKKEDFRNKLLNNLVNE